MVACLALALAACGAGGTQEQGSDKITIGFAVSGLDNPFYVAMKEGLERAAAEQGVAVIVVNAGNNPDTQTEQVRTLTTQGVRAIVINPVDSRKAKQAADAAQTALVPLVSVDSSIYDATVVSEVASDNVQGGALAAIELGRATSGNIVHLTGIPGSSVTHDRGFGFEQGLNSGGITIVAKESADFNRDRAFEVMTNLLRTNNNITGVFADNDEMALGAMKALGARAGKEVRIVGFDGTPEAVAAVNAGTLAATVVQQPEQLGRKAFEQAVKAARHQRVQQVVDVPVEILKKGSTTRLHS